MSIQTSDREYRLTQALMSAVYVLLIGALFLAAASASADDEPTDEVRTSTTKHFAEGGRNADQPTDEIRDEFAPLSKEGNRVSPGAGDTTASGDADTPALGRATSSDFWFYEADVVLFGDDDADGFYFGIDLLFDVDTIWSSAAVYAVAYLSYEGGPWNEYAVTGDFIIEGASGTDEYVLVSELESGYPTGDYDILIELYDADTGVFLADFGPESSSALGYLPLEDYNRDAPPTEPPVVVVSHGHGGAGSTGLAMLLALGVAGTLRLRRKAGSA